MMKYCLILACWGDAYSDLYVNELVRAARSYSPELEDIVLFTDRARPNIDPVVRQEIFPAFFNRSEFFGHGYRVKISVFSRDCLPAHMPCVYLDLDSMVIGNLGKIAGLVKNTNDFFMLPPGDMLGFGSLRRLIFRLTKGRRFATGNSSVMAFHSAASPNISELFARFYQSGESGRHMAIDDVFISWASQSVVRGVPRTLAVMFRREFLARTRIGLWAKSQLPSSRKSRLEICVVTFNGMTYKANHLLALEEGQRIEDPKGRFGYWSEACLGPTREKIREYCRRVMGK
jgi:hypothetical protein